VNNATKLETQQWLRKLRVEPRLFVGCVLVAAIGGWLWVRGAAFYALPLSERVEHADYGTLSPSRAVGKNYGFAAAGLMLCNLAYLLRKQVPQRPLGGMRLWLDLHVLTGLGSAVFAAYHSAFQLRSPVAIVTFASLVITVVTGIVGRFFHALASHDGPKLASRLVLLGEFAPGIPEYLEQQFGSLSRRSERHVHLVARLARLRAEAVARRALVRDAWGTCLADVPTFERRYAAKVAREVEQLAVREVYVAAGRELLAAWRPWHRLCALTVLGGVLLHIGIAVFYGYV